MHQQTMLSKRRRKQPRRYRLRLEALEARRLLAVAVQDPGFSYVDADNDGLYDVSAGDVALISGELDDGIFDTRNPEGGYTTAIPDAGLGIYGTPISIPFMSYFADGRIDVGTELTATSGDVVLTARGQHDFFNYNGVNVQADLSATDEMFLTVDTAKDVCIENAELISETLRIAAGRNVKIVDSLAVAEDSIEIVAGRDSDIDDSVLLATARTSVARFESGEDVLVSGSRVEAGKLVDMDAGTFVIVQPSATNDSIVAATQDLLGKVDMNADTSIEVSVGFGNNTDVVATKDIVMSTNVLRSIESTLTAVGNSAGKIDLHGTFQVNVTGAALNARREVVIQSDTERVIADDVAISASNLESTVLIDAGTDLDASGAQIEAGKAVTMIAGEALFAGGSMIRAVPNSLGNVTLRALELIDVTDSQIRAHKTIDVQGGAIDVDRARLAADGASSANIILHAAFDIDAVDVEMFANKHIFVQTGLEEIFLTDALLQTNLTPGSGIEINAALELDATGADIATGALLQIHAGGSVAASDATLVALPADLGKVEITSVTSTRLEDATIWAHKNVEVDSGSHLFGDGVLIQVKGHSNGSIDLDAGGDMELDGAELCARKDIELEAVDSIYANEVKLLAQGNYYSTVRATAGGSMDLIEATIRARWLIDLIAADVANLPDSSIGITHPGPGDLCITATSIVIEGAVLKAPDELKLNGLVFGDPECQEEGTLPEEPGCLTCVG